MTIQQTTRVVPAGWYEDPADHTKVRWWNGMTWTEHVEPKPAGQHPGTPASAQAARPVVQDDVLTRRAAMSLDERGPATGTIPIQGIAAPRRPVRTSTMSVWLLACTPLFASALSLIAGYVYFYVTPTPLVAAVAIVLYLLGFLWAVGDRRALQSRGIESPNPLWTLVPVLGVLLYLILRRRHAEGGLPVVAFLGLLLATVVAPLALILMGGAPTITKALEVQQAVHDDLVGSGAVLSVSCPPIVESTSTGTVYTCDATLPSGDPARVWISFDDDDGNFSWAIANR